MTVPEAVTIAAISARTAEALPLLVSAVVSTEWPWWLVGLLPALPPMPVYSLTVFS